MERVEPKPPSKSNQEPIRFGIDQILGSLDQESRIGNTVDNSRLGSPPRASVAPHVSLPVSLSGVTGALEDSGGCTGWAALWCPVGWFGFRRTDLSLPRCRRSWWAPHRRCASPGWTITAGSLKTDCQVKDKTSPRMLEFVHTMQRYLAARPAQLPSEFFFFKAFIYTTYTTLNTVFVMILIIINYL